MRLFLLATFGLLASTNAFADCVFGPPQQIDVKIDKVSAPVYDAKGNLLDGCLLSANGEVLGYATEDGLCHMTPGQTITVILGPQGCCDTGRGRGDFTCAMRSVSDSGTVYGNGMVVSSVAP